MNRFMRLIFALIFFVSFVNAHAQDQFYNRDSIQKIEIYFSQPNWDYMMDTAKLGAEGYIPASFVLLNGQRFDSVGVKYKGNSTYDSASLKNPWHIKLSKYKTQSYGPITDIKLANGYKDPSGIREVLGYRMLSDYMDCPQSNFAQLYVNGQYVGLYTNDEDVDKPFLKNHFYSSGNAFFKCSYSNPSPTVRPNLKFLGTDPKSYYMYEMESKTGWNELIALCDTLYNHPESIRKIMDLDRVIWMLAFNNVMVNLDSYSGLFVQNYYLYKDGTGRFNPIVWDLNMCFGGFPYAGNQSGGLGMLSAQNMQQFPTDFHKADSDWPLIKLIFSNQEYTKKYYAHLKTILEEQLQGNQWKNEANRFMQLIDTAVKSDIHFMYSYNDFKNSISTDLSGGSYMIPGIANLLDARVNYLLSQLPLQAKAPDLSQVQGWNTGNNIYKFTATVTDADTVILGYRTDSTKAFTYTRLYDDGSHQDGVANDGTYATMLGETSPALDFYIYAANQNAGKFYPVRAEHEYLNTLSFNGLTPLNATSENQFKCFPNPVIDILHGITAGGGATYMQLTDLTGKTIWQGEVSTSFSLDLKHLPRGIYILSDGIHALKIVKITERN